MLTRDDVAGYLHDIDSGHDVDRVIRELVSLEWLVASRRKGVWVYLTAGGPPTTDTLVAICAFSSIEKLTLPWAFVVKREKAPTGRISRLPSV